MFGRSNPATISPSVGDAQLRQDVGARPFVGRRGQGQARHVRIVVQKGSQLAIVGPEIVPPFADAMRLVDRDQRQRHVAQQLAKAARVHPLRRDIDEVEFAIPEPLRGSLAIAVGGGQRCGADTERIRASDLVVHQCDQRRHDERRPRPRQCGQLVAE